MVAICVCVVFTLLASALAMPYPMEDPIAKLDSEEKEVLIPFPPNVDQNNTGSWSETMVIKIFYNCKGHLVREELSKVRMRNEEGKQAEKLQNLQRSNSENEINKSSQIPTMPMRYQSKKERFKHPKNPKMTIKPQSVPEDQPQSLEQPDQKDQPQSLEQPDQKDQSQSLKQPNQKDEPQSFGPDMIIDTPMRPCPPGQNYDHFNNCRNIIPE